MKCKRLLIVPDTHAPYHNVRAWQIMLEVAHDWKPKAIVHLGDLVDFYCLSQHGGSDPQRARFVEEEAEPGKECLKELNQLGAEEKVYLFGNHEDRLRRWLADKSPQFSNVLRVETLLNLRTTGWQHVAYKQHYTRGKVKYVHDLGKAGAGATHAALNQAQASVVMGHVHRFDWIVTADITGKQRTALCPGWLGDASKIDYEHALLVRTQWVNGFALAEEYEDGVTMFYPIPFVNHTVRWQGRIYK